VGGEASEDKDGLDLIEMPRIRSGPAYSRRRLIVPNTSVPNTQDGQASAGVRML
jgi:hypothetical protein